MKKTLSVSDYKKLLKKIQFSATEIYDYDHIVQHCCPICHNNKAAGHAPDCELAAALEEEE